MKVIAVAGGTGHVGRPIVETLARSPSFKVVVLGRKTNPDLPGFSVYIQNDYKDIEALAQILTQHNVHTVISTIQITDETASTAEVNLIRAADSSSSAKRFIASSWGSLPNENSPTSGYQEASIGQLRKTTLEWTRFAVGFFLDYYGLPHIKTHLPGMSFAVDVAHRKAAIPGTGNDPISFTYTYDVARFVAVFLDEPRWEELTVCYGERTTWNGFLKVAEQVTGQSFEVVYDSVEKLQGGEVTELPSHKAELAASPFPEPIARHLLAVLGLWAVNGQFDIQQEKSLNLKYPEIKPMRVREALLCGCGRE
ncbi:Isoflavone reductase P3-like protein 1 [Colletotrichum chlorophyti]|uniref:Isoflavone reductase P3-like protein 1 n=1 Tax=Colletotrichum chlorophyti TaxID=708187 RepID=A0A1Q8RN61_9PEZI|nr:Isoflavone reductase P3-like protein 1 [Colletotrichum chlorophyti]